MSDEICLILHRKSANRLEVKDAVKAVVKSGIPLRVRIPWNKADKAVVVREAVKAGARRIIAGRGDGTINAVVNALVGNGKKPPLPVSFL
jgi:diacylglycerol kinase family enzyme